MSIGSVLRRPKLRHVLFLVLLLSGIIPLVLSNALLIRQNRERLEAGERTELTQAAEALSREVSDQLATVRNSLRQLGSGLLMVPAPRGTSTPQARLRQDWVASYVQNFMLADTSLPNLRVLDLEGIGLEFGPRDLPEAVQQARDAAFEAARESGRTAYRFAAMPADNLPVASLAVPVGTGDGAKLVIEALVDLPLMEAVLRREAQGESGLFLLDAEGQVLWSQGASEEASQALASSDLARGIRGSVPAALTREYDVTTGETTRKMLAQVSFVGETGWAVVVQKPAAAAFAEINRMVVNAVVATAVLVALALGFAVVAARWVSSPIQRLAETSHEIAQGNFGRRVEGHGLPAELGELARDFNQMSGKLEVTIEHLRQAARANRELFIGSIRAFAAAIDAKDPYTRGHSERVASVSRIIARNLSLPEETRQKIWIAGVLHDVGKIGVEDQILRKVGRLTDDEYEQMKQHTVIGADIMASIEPLREMLPVIRWHHESWNGRGYPDGKKGEQIPLWARIVAVADTFDAITTNRPYQKAFSLDEAISIITKLTGSRFDAKVVTAFFRAYESGEVTTPDPGPAPKAEAEKVARIGLGALS